MITKNADYDTTSAYGQGEFKTPPKGGYVCKIFKVEEKSDKNGNPMIHIAFDIVEGEYKDFFKEMFRSKKEKADDPFKVKYPFEGQMWISTTDYEDRNKTSRKFKGFCTALEESGTQVWKGNNFDMDALNGALIGIVYQNQEQEYNGKVYWRAVPWGCRSIDSIMEGDYFVPEDKPLPKEDNDPVTGFASVDTEDVPF